MNTTRSDPKYSADFTPTAYADNMLPSQPQSMPGSNTNRYSAGTSYVYEPVLERLKTHDPFTLLNDTNMADFYTALEGGSHFQ